ncbi:MAG: radical SAM protein [Bacteroidales bacterium]|nr:radical SAM protein [Bacteroidales bacterium]
MEIYLLKYISLKKLINLFKIYLGYYLSILLKKVVVLGYPFSITTEPTNNCNLHCLECPSGNDSSKRIKGNIDFELYKKIIDEVKDFIIYQMIYFQGEPFLNPEFFNLISYADNNNIYTNTSTNGHFLSPENCEKIVKSGLKKIIISIDGTTQETYEKYRVEGTLEKVIEGIQNLVITKQQLKSKYPVVHIQFLVLKHNEHQIKEINSLAKSLGVNKLELKSAQIENFEENSDLIPALEKFSRYNNRKTNFKIKSKLLNRCFRIWSTLIVNQEGTIVPCCFDKELQYPVGNAINNSALKIWKSKEFAGFRRNILLNRKKTPICRNCTEGLRIKY